MDQQNKNWEWIAVIDNLRKDIKSDIQQVRTENREDIKGLCEDSAEWHEEVRQEFSEVKVRLTIIETKAATREEDSGTKFAKWGSFAAIALSLITLYSVIHPVLH
jgi:hypothetical protein